MNFDKRPKKRIYQSMIFSQSQSKIFIGLLGPSPIPYLKAINYKEYEHCILYETDIKTFISSKGRLGNIFPTVTPVYGSIMSAQVDPNAFYDFDFCYGIKQIEKYLPEIVKIKQFTLTCALRGTDRQKTIAIFKKYLKTNNFIVMPNYNDGSGPMLLIYKY